MQSIDPQEQLHAACAKILDSAEGKLLLRNWVIVALQTDDPAVRVGRSDIILQTLRWGQRSDESTPPARSVKARAPLGQTTEQE
jgi:hypothetical protein